MWKEIFFRLLLTSLLAFSAQQTQAASAGCFNLVSDLQRNWMEVRRHLVPSGENLNSPKDDDFICISNGATRNALERTVSLASSIRCFRHSTIDAGFCCDRNVASCAQLNPQLFPDRVQTRQQQEEYVPPKSNWVRPPADGDQWKSN